MSLLPNDASEDDGAGSVQGSSPGAIVGIGASAGGIEALEQLFRNMTPDSGAAFVVKPITLEELTGAPRQAR
jgi:two-component system CheB/CheR fusion protein